jgi:hypothetical protein
MGTRGVTMVIQEEKAKIAQYGQWDHYPSGQGLTALEILRNTIMKSKESFEDFKEKVSKVETITQHSFDEKLEEVGIDSKKQFITFEESDRFKEKYPYLHRDCGAEVLKYIADGSAKELQHSFNYAQTGFDCEWCYAVNLDKETFEVYDGNYIPHNLKGSFDLNNLPTEEEFLKHFEVEEEGEDNVY